MIYAGYVVYGNMFEPGEHVKHCYPRNWTIWRAGLTVALFALLQGCATDNPKTAADSPGKAGANGAAKKHAVVVSREQKADFDAAMQLVKKEDYEKAAELLDKVVKAEPQNAIPSVNLALVYEKLGKMKEAEESLKLAVSADPENPVAANEYALLYRRTGRFTEARALYEKTLEKYPNFVMAHKNLGVLCDLYLKDYECAIKHYTVYSAVYPDDKTVKIWIADLRQRSGK